MDPQTEKNQLRRLQKIRQSRDQFAVDSVLRDLKEAAEGSDNLVPFIIASVEINATVGEIADVLRKTFGEYQETVVI